MQWHSSRPGPLQSSEKTQGEEVFDKCLLRVVRQRMLET